MSEEYRQKLLNWVLSALLISAGTSIAMLLTWFLGISEQRANGITENGHPTVAALGEAMLLYPLLIPVALFWHFFDFIQSQLPSSRLGLLIGSFRTFFCAMGLLIILWNLAGTGYFTYNSCDQLPTALFYECFITISRWIMIPIWIAIGSLLVLCIAKIFAAVHSIPMRFK